MKQNGKGICHGLALVMAQSLQEGLLLSLAMPELFLSVSDVCRKMVIGFHFPFGDCSDGQCWKW